MIPMNQAAYEAYREARGHGDDWEALSDEEQAAWSAVVRVFYGEEES